MNNHRKVATEFVDKYYRMMQNSPDQLFKFYKKQSIFTFTRETDGAVSTAIGQEQIHQAIMFALQPLLGHIHMVSKSQIDHQASRQGGLLVLVTGQLLTYDGYCQHFTQSFFLDEQQLPTPGYFVLTDFLRYVDAASVPAVQQCAPPGAQTAMQAGVPVMAGETMPYQDAPVPCLGSPLGAMHMMSPHSVAGAGQPQAWVQPRPHPSMMHPMHAAPVPQQRQMQVEQMVPMLGVGDSATSSGFPAVSQSSLQPMVSPTCPAMPVEVLPCDLNDHVLQREEIPEISEEAPKPAESSASAVTELADGEGGDGWPEEGDEAEAEVQLDYEEEAEEEYSCDIPQLQEMEGRSPTAASMEGDAAAIAKPPDDDDDDEANVFADYPSTGVPDPQDSGGGGSGAATASANDGVASGVNEPQDQQYASFPAFEEPRSWASLAGRLKEGGGQLVQSKVQGYGSPAGASSFAASPTSKGTATASNATGSADRGNGGEYTVWLWISRLPMDATLEAQEILDCITSYLSETGRAIELDRRDSSQEWANIAVSSQEAADMVLQLSRDRKLLLRGKSLKADLHRSSYGSGRPRRGGGKTGGDGSPKGASKGDDERSGEGRGVGRGRRPRKGGGEKGDRGGDAGRGNWWSSNSRQT